MPVELNHIIVPATNKDIAAGFIAKILGLSVGAHWGPFAPVLVANGVTLDYVDRDSFLSQHYAFLVTEAEFDEIMSRLEAEAVISYADPDLERPGEINHHYGGRGVYFHDPGGHLMEVITQPYGAVPEG